MIRVRRYIFARWQQTTTQVAGFFQRIKQANIILMVLFIMFVSSLLGLIVAQYVQHLIQVSGLFQNYYRAYYYAYGGLELGLAQSKFHGYGFQDGVDNDFVFEDYLACTSSNFTCDTDISIKSRWNPIADSYEDFSSCGDLLTDGGATHTYYSLDAGDAIILPLFVDAATGFTAPNYDDITFSEMQTINPLIYATGTVGTATYLVKVIDEDLENYNVTLSPTLDESQPYDLDAALLTENPPDGYESDPTNKNYLIIANATGDTKTFCIELDGSYALVSKYITIDSIGRYRDSIASLSAIKVDQLPSFLGYGTINSW